mgnify:CR=1 FL=1
MWLFRGQNSCSDPLEFLEPEKLNLKTFLSADSLKGFNANNVEPQKL